MSWTKEWFLQGQLLFRGGVVRTDELDSWGGGMGNGGRIAVLKRHLQGGEMECGGIP